MSKLYKIRSHRKEQKNIKEILRRLYEEEKAYEEVKHSLIASGKSEQISNTLREKGSQFYKMKNFEKALEFYNLSIMAAPHPVLMDEGTRSPSDFVQMELERYGGVTLAESVALAKALANRSAVMCELKLYDKCLQDIDLAIEYGYPEDLLPKLDRRKRMCIEWQAASGQEKSDDNLNSPLHRFLKIILPEGSPLTNSLENRISKKPEKLPTLPESNSSIPCLSNAVKMYYNPQKGRGLVASRDIIPGEVLGIERAFSLGLNESRLTTYCSTCACLCLTPLPCPGCSKAVFCNKSCRMRGLAEDHWLDCRILPSLIAAGKGRLACSYKPFKNLSCQQLLTMIKRLDNEKQDNPENLGFNNKGIFSSTSHRAVHHLHRNTDLVSEEELTEICRDSFITTKFLEQSGRYFLNDLGEPVAPSREDILGTCEALLMNMARKWINAFSLENKKPDDFLIFSAISLVNHACNSSADVVTFGREGVLVCTVPILTGEEVTMGYITFLNMKRADRINLCKDCYGFVCKCKACEGNWPNFRDLPLIKFRDLNCQIPQEEEQRVAHAVTEVKRIEDNVLIQGKYSLDDFQIVCKAYDLLNQHLAMPCVTLVRLKTTMALYARKGFVRSK